MASDLPTEQMASYSPIIDDILASADLDIISAKAIRKGLQAKVDYDLSDQKEAITALIMERFDKAQQRREAVTTTIEPAPTANGTNGTTHHKASASPPPSHKRKADSEDDDDDDDDSLSDVKDSPPPKKIKKAPKPEAESDEQIARRLQAEFSAARGRSTRGGGATTTTNKKKSTAKKDKKPKKKSATKVHSSDDSDLDSSPTSPKPEKEKKGGFHKLMNLSPPLVDLLGESQLSRPQTVKRIWAYVKERELQDPADKRQIRCDEKMRAVFKTEKVHMFTMNKVLATQLWPAEEV